MKPKNRTAIYMRVSTTTQKHDLQKDGLKAYAERADLEIVEEYLDLGFLTDDSSSSSLISDNSSDPFFAGFFFIYNYSSSP